MTIFLQFTLSFLSNCFVLLEFFFHLSKDQAATVFG